MTVVLVDVLGRWGALSQGLRVGGRWGGLDPNGYGVGWKGGGVVWAGQR